MTHSPYNFPSVDAKAWYEAAKADLDGRDEPDFPQLVALIEDYERVRDERTAKIERERILFERVLQEAKAYCDRRASVASPLATCTGRWSGCSRTAKWTVPRADPADDPQRFCTQHLVEAAAKDAAKNHRGGWEAENKVKRALTGYVK